MDLAWTCQIKRRTTLGPTAWTRREAYGTNAQFHIFGDSGHMDLTWTYLKNVGEASSGVKVPR